MKTLTLFLRALPVALLLLLTQAAHASHIVGGEITYQCLGNNQYEIILDVYRDCFYGAPNAQFDDPAMIGIYDQAGQLKGQLNIALMQRDTIDADLGDPCLFVPGDVCVETTRYRQTVTLSPLPGGYVFSYQRCCRNQTISNIADPDETGASFVVRLTEAAIAACNGAPEFDNFPPIFICINKPIEFDHSATDSDGDELIYRLNTPVTGGTINNPQPSPSVNTAPPYDPVTFIAPFSLDDLLGAGSGPNADPLTIDPNTGLITGLPTMQGQFVVGICVEERRNGVLLSTVCRDFQYNVGQCSEITADIVAPDAQCDDLTVDFEANFGAGNIATNVVWYFDWPNLTPTATDEITSYTYPDTGSYTVALIAEPGASCADTAFQEVFLQFNSLDADFSLAIFDCTDVSVIDITSLSTDNIGTINSYTYTVNVDGGGSQTYTEADPVAQVPLGSTGTITLDITSENGCVASRTRPYTTGTFNPTDNIENALTICAGESVALNPNAPDTLINYTYSWSANTGDPTALNPTVSPAQTTTYSVTITAVDNICFVTEDITVTVLELPELAFDAQIDCNGTTVTFLNQSTNATDFVWDFGDPTTSDDTSTEVSPTYTYPTTGDYTVTLRTAPGERCQDELVRTISLPVRVLEADFDFDYTDGCGTDAITIQFNQTVINSLDNTDGYSWTFSNGETSTAANPSIALTEEQQLTVTLTVTTAEGCTDVISRTLNVDFTELDNLPTEDVQVCPGETAELNPGGDMSYDYLWSPATGLSDPTSANPTANPTETTTYTVTVTNLTGADTCVVSQEVTVVVPPAIGLGAIADVETCEAQATLEAITVEPVDFVWTDATGTVVSTDATLTVAVSGADTYTITATDAFGCSVSSDPVTVAGGPVDITVPGEQIVCADDPLDISVTNLDNNDQLSYQWAPDPLLTGDLNTATPQVTVQPTPFTSLEVTATNQYGCTSTDSIFVVIVDDKNELGFTSEVQCNGATVEFTNTSTDAFAFVWDFGDPNSTADVSSEVNPSYTYSEPGTYTVALTIPFDLACVDTFFAQIEILEPEIVAGIDYSLVNCTEDVLNFQFSDASINNFDNTTAWSWTFTDAAGNTTTAGGPNPQYSATVAGDLTVSLTINTGNGCDASTSIVVPVDFINVDLVAADTICIGESVTLNPGGNDQYSYLWSPQTGLDDPTATSPVASPTEPTTYVVFVTNNVSGECTLQYETTVFVPEQIQLSTNGVDQTCGEPVELVASSNVAVDYTWTGGGLSGTGATLTVDPADVETYTVLATDAFGCTSETSVTVTNQAVDVSLDATATFCPADTYDLSIANNDAGDDLVYVWVPGSGGSIVSGGNTATPTVTAPFGTTTFTVTTTNQFNCSETNSIDVTVVDFQNSEATTVQACGGVPTLLYDGNPDYTYTWTPTTGLDLTDPAQPLVTAFTDQVYTAEVATGGGQLCEAQVTVTVEVFEAIDLQVTGDTTVCEAGPVTLGASSAVAVDYIWYQNPDYSGALSTDATLTVEDEGTTTYYLLAEDANGCFDSTSVTVQAYPISISLVSSTDLCLGETTTLTVENTAADQDLTYSWDPDLGNQDNPTVSPSETTTYDLTVTNQFGCSFSTSTTVNVFDVEAGLTISADPDTIKAGRGDEVQLNVTDVPGYTYNWTPAKDVDDATVPDPIATPTETTTFSVVVTDAAGCTAEREVTVTVLDEICDDPFIFIPSAFSPNGDGDNDVFFVRGNEIESVELFIYNRWGQQIFQSNDLSEGWDGRFKNELLEPDVYGYYVRATCFNGDDFFRKGNVTLLR